MAFRSDPEKDVCCRRLEVDRPRASGKLRRPVFFLAPLLLGAVFVHLALTDVFPIAGFIRSYVENYRANWHKQDYDAISSFKELPSSPELDFRRCLDDNLCARLEVPLDWNSTDANDQRKMIIAIMLKPAKVDVTDPRYGGPLLWNPGGPGGVATDIHPLLAPNLQSIVDTPNERYFDILSFDPRGVGNTEPRIKGIEDRLARVLWQRQLSAVGMEIDNNSTFDYVWAQLKAYGYSTAQQNEAESSYDTHAGQFVTTALVVRDMVEIIERFGIWREKHAKELLRARGDSDDSEALERTRHRCGEEKLNFWGFSYGTILGQTFAVLQPHRVQRMVLDGTVDLQDYTAGQWLLNLQDSEGVVAAFASACIDAGPLLCPIASWATGGYVSTWLRKYYNLLEELKHDPFISFDPRTGRPIPITHSDVVTLLFVALRSPILGFSYAADLLHAVEKGDTLLLNPLDDFQCAGPKEGPDGVAATTAIHCTDSESMLNITKDEFLGYFDELRSQSPVFASILASIRMPCHGYNARPKWRFEGPFSAQTPVGILFTDQSLDIITPIRNGELAAKLFPGAGVLEATGIGHCSIAMPNMCAVKKIRKYYLDGKTQQEKIVCPQEYNPFEFHRMGSMSRQNMTEDDVDLWLAATNTQTNWAKLQMHYGNLNRLYL